MVATDKGGLMTTDLAIRRSEVPASFQDQMHMAKVLADSTLLPAYLRGKPANVLVILQGARALDVSAFWALQSMHVIEGKLGMAAELMRALVIRAGHRCRVVERSMTRAVVEIKRSDSAEPYRAEFTWEDAKAAGLEKKTNWIAYRKSMLVARATTIAVRDECPDVMFGVAYTPEELGAITDADGNPTVDDDGNPLVDAEVAEPLTDEQVAEIGTSLVDIPLEELPALWAHVTDRAAQFRRVGPDSDESLTDYVAARIGVETGALLPVIEGGPCGSKAEARALWDLVNILRLGDATVLAGGETVNIREYIRRVGALLPDAAVPDDPPAAEEPVVEVEVVEAEILPDTEHARRLAEDAAASWGDTVAKIHGEREQVFQNLAEQRARAAATEAQRKETDQ